jgi:DNA-binding transcriptional LysR family regulator
MEINQLEYFKTLAHINHFTQAAQTISISQPALSRSIAKLEHELGVPLFNRIGKKISLTPYGQTFLVHIERALQEINRGHQAIADLTKPDQGNVHLSFLHSLGAYLIPNLLSRFRQIYPKIHFSLDQNNSANLTRQLLDEDTDLCICSTFMTTTPFCWKELYSEEIFVAVPSNHRLANRKSIHLKEIANEPLVTFKPMYSLRILADTFFNTVAIRPRITFEGDEIVTVASFVAANLGVALIPHSPSLDYLDLVFLPISQPVCSRTIILAWNQNKYISPAAHKFQQFITNIFDMHKSIPLTPYISKE